MKTIIQFITKLWNKRRRQIDLDILWPACKENAINLDHAKAAFAVHAFADPAWNDLDHDEKYAIIDRLS